MEQSTRSVIDGLAAQAAPVRPMRPRQGYLLTLAAFAATLVAVLLVFGARQGLLEGDVSSAYIVANGMLLVLGLACASAAVAMASPRVGEQHNGPKWAMAMAGVLPAAGLVALARLEPSRWPALSEAHCAALGLLASALVAGALCLWLRKGAPAAPQRAGLYVGTAAGALGTLAYGIACPFDSIAHLGIWHAAPVFLAALAGRFVLARLLRW